MRVRSAPRTVPRALGGASIPSDATAGSFKKITVPNGFVMPLGHYKSICIYMGFRKILIPFEIKSPILSHSDVVQ